jgi:hypothetical protein
MRALHIGDSLDNAVCVGSRQTPALRFAMRRATLVAGIALLLSTPSARGQDPWITVSEPGEWSQNEVLSVPAGTRLRVVGQAYHPQGVQSVSVGGQQANVRRQTTGIVDFDAIVTVAAGITSLRASLQATGGGTFSKDLRLAVSGGAAPQTTAVVYNPISAAARSVFLPGLGQFYTGRPAMGVAFTAVAGAALAAAVMSKKTTVQCLAPAVDGACPSGQVGSESVKRPMLIPGVAAFLALGVVSAVEAHSAAAKLNRGPAGSNDNAGFALSLQSIHGRYGVSLYSVRF